MAKVKDMTVGSPAKNIIKFCLPLMMGNLFQQFYNMADTIIVGQFVGKSALSAVGSVGSLNFLIIGSIIGLCSGFAIPVAQSFGAKDYNKLKRIVANTIYTSLVLGAVITVCMVFATKPLLHLLNIPDDIFKDAYDYIVIIFAGIGATMLYNVVAGMLRALGDSKTPLYFLVFSSLLNIGLDLVLIIVFKMGVAGAAIATVASQLISGLLCVYYSIKKFPMLALTKETKGFDLTYVGELLKNGVPMALQMSLTAIGSVMMQSCVNSLGSEIIAGMTIGNKTQLMIVLPVETIGIAMATYCGQHLGARKYKRIKKGIAIAVGLSFCYSFIAFFVSKYLGSYIGLLFIDKSETAVLALSQQYLDTCAWFYPILGIIFVFRNALQGMGYSLTAMTAGVFELVTRGVGGFGFVTKYGFDAACFVNPSAWLSADIFLIPATIVVMKKVKKKIYNENEEQSE